MATLDQQIARLRADPGDESAAQGVRTLGQAAKAYGAYAAAFAERGTALAARGEVSESTRARVEAALVFEENLHALSDAAAQYEAVLALEPLHRRGLFSLGLLLHDLKRWDDLIDLYRRRIAASDHAGEQTTLHLYTAEVLAEHKQDNDAAFLEVMAAARLAPQNIRIIGRLETLGAETNRHSEVAVTIGDLILNQQDPKVRAALSLRLAELYMGPLGDETRALAYLRAALADDGGNPEILQEMEDVFRERNRFDALAELLEVSAEDRRTGPHRVRLERELARIYELQLDDVPRALLAVRRAVLQTPDDRELLDEVMRLGLIAGDLRMVAQTFEEVIELTDNALLQTYLRLKLGHIYGQVLSRPEEAVRTYGAILEQEPANLEARQRLLRLHERRGEHAEVARLLEAELAGMHGAPEAFEGLEKLVSLYRDRIDEPSLAVQACRRLLELDPEHPQALEVLRTHAQDGRTPSGVDADPTLPEVPDSAMMRGDEEAATDYMGEGYGPESETHFADNAVPVPRVLVHPSASEMQVDEDPVPDGEIVHEESDPTIALLDNQVLYEQDEGGAAAVLAPSAAPSASPFLFVVSEASEALREKETTAGPSHGLSERLVEVRAQLEDADEYLAAELLEEIAAIAESQENFEEAYEAQARLTELDPGLERVEDLLRLAGEVDSWSSALEIADRVSRGLGEAAELHFGLELADIEQSKLHDHPAAAARLGRLNALTSDGSLFGRWLAALDKADLHAELSEALLAKASECSDGREALLFVQRAVALIETQLEDPSRAADVLIEHATANPEQDGLHAQAAALLRKAERWPELVEVYTQQMARQEEAERAELRLKIAALYQGPLEDPEAAEATIRQGLEERVLDPELLEALWALLQAEERWAELMEAGLRRVEVVRSPRIRCALRCRLAEVAEEHLNDSSLAEEILNAALAEDPRDMGGLRHLERLRRDREDWDGVYDLLELQVAACEPGEDQARALFAMAEIRAEGRGDLDGAADLLRQVVQIEPAHDDALGYLASVEERRGDYVGAADVLRVHIEAREAAGRPPLHVRLGALLLSHFGDLEGARQEYEAVLAIEPEHLDAQVALLSIAEAEENYLEAYDLGTKVAGQAPLARQQAELYVKAGQIAQMKLGDERRAIVSYEAALLADPEDLVTEARLGELFLDRGEPEAAHPHLYRAAQGLSDPQRSAELFRQAGQAAEKVDATADAQTAYEAVLEHSPTDLVALDRLGALLCEQEAWPRTYEVSANLILHHESDLGPKERAQVFLRMARAQRARSEFDNAHRLAKQAHHLDTSLSLPLEIMAEVLEAGGEAFEAAECLKRIALLSDTGTGKAKAMLQAGRLLQEQAEDPARGAAMLTEAQTADPTLEEVAHRLAACRLAVNDAPGAADALEVLAEHREARASADLRVQAARILLGANRDRSRARELLEQALSTCETHLAARHDLEVVLEFDEDLLSLALHWQAVAQSLVTSEAEPEDLEGRSGLEVASDLLCRAMALYRDRLAEPGRALEVLRILMAMPEQPDWQQDYAELLDAQLKVEVGPRDTLIDEAIQAWSTLVEQRPGYAEGLRRLHSLRSEAGEHHLANVASELLTAIGEPEGADLLSDESVPTQNLARVQVSVWPEEESQLGAMLGELGFAPLKVLQDILPETKLKKKELVGAAGLGIHVSRPLEAAATLLGVPVPLVYVRETATDAVLPMFAGEAGCLVVSLGKAQERSEDELRFLFGRALSLLRPRALALAITPLEALRDTFVGFAKVAEPETKHADPKTAKRRGRLLEKALSQGVRVDLSVQVATWMATDGRRSLGAEQQAVFRTAERMGLVASGSLTTALQTLASMSAGRMESAWRMPLIRYAATHEYTEIIRRRA